MDTSTTIIGTILVLACIAPIVYMLTKQSQKNKKNIKQLKSFAQQQGLNLDYTETTHRLVLGYDKESRTLVFASLLDKEKTYQLIQMNSVKRAWLSVSELEKNEIEKISIQLEGNNPIKELVFYDDFTDSGKDTYVCKHIAKSWVNIIKQ